VSAVSCFRTRYGARLLHLAGFALCLLVSGLAVRRFFDSAASDTVKIFAWLGGAIVAHDLVVLPLYSLLDRVIPARVRVYVRIPLILSGLMLLVFFPLILRRSAVTYQDASGLSPHVYLARWLIATGVLFALSAAVFAVRTLRSARGQVEARAAGARAAGAALAAGAPAAGAALAVDARAADARAAGAAAAAEASDAAGAADARGAGAAAAAEASDAAGAADASDAGGAETRDEH
jgi:hypothetical protein